MGNSMNDDESMDDFFEEEEVFLENAVHCPICDELTGHEILNEKPKGTGADYLLKCIDCSKVHTVHIRPPPVVEIPFILTEGPQSSTSRLEIDADEMIELEDVFQDDEKLWRINQIELHNGKKAKRAEASLIARASALRSDMVRVKLTMTRGEESEADVLVVPEGTTYTAGHLIDLEGKTWRIRAIHTGRGRTLRGTVDAPDIKRMYLHEPPNPEHFEPRTPMERRQAWKDGRLGYNPNPVLPKEITKKGVNPNNRRKKQPRR